MERKPIESAVEELKSNLDTVARVYEWSELMRYEEVKLFSRHFLRHFRCRPIKVLTEIRIQSIIKMLTNTNKPCFEIAWKHSMTDEKSLNNYLNRHLGLSPSIVRELSFAEIRKTLKSRGVKVRSKGKY